MKSLDKAGLSGEPDWQDALETGVLTKITHVFTKFMETEAIGGLITDAAIATDILNRYDVTNILNGAKQAIMNGPMIWSALSFTITELNQTLWLLVEEDSHGEPVLSIRPDRRRAS